MSRKVSKDPRVIAKSLAMIVDVIGDVDGERMATRYRSAYDYRLEKPHQTEAGRGSKGKSDPTGATVASQERVSNAVEAAAKEIAAAHEAIDNAAFHLRSVFRGGHPERQDAQMVSDVELREAREAKRKRELTEELAALEQRKVKIRRELG